MEDKMYLDWKEKKISREEESKMPSFTSHDDARAYFKNRFGDDFQMVDSSEFEDEKIYFYNLILNKDYYMSYIRDAKVRAESDSSLLFTLSYQRIEINENGNVHILH